MRRTRFERWIFVAWLVLLTWPQLAHAGPGQVVPAGTCRPNGPCTIRSLTLTTATAPAVNVTGIAAGAVAVQLPSGARLHLGGEAGNYIGRAAASTLGIGAALRFEAPAGAILESSVAATGGIDVAFTFDTPGVTLGAGGKLMSLKHTGAEKAFIDKDGTLSTSGYVIGNIVYANSGLYTVPGSVTATVRSTQVDGATAIGVVIDNSLSLATAGARMLSVRTGGAERYALASGTHELFTGTAPTLSACGTSPIIAGNDSVGRVTYGSGVVGGCVLTFSVAWANPPTCVVNAPGGETVYAGTTTTIVGVSGGGPGTVVEYRCAGW